MDCQKHIETAIIPRYVQVELRLRAILKCHREAELSNVRYFTYARESEAFGPFGQQILCGLN